MTNIAALAAPVCSIDIYPFEGGKYTLSGGQILSLSTRKNIREDVGQFQLVLAPGNAPNATTFLSWSQLITPLSLIVIGLRRGSVQSVVMIGVVQAVNESQRWAFQSQVQRSISISGMDMAYYFTNPDYYSLWTITALGAAGAKGISNAGLIQGTPKSIGQKWFDLAMRGVFASTVGNYRGGKITFDTIFGVNFEEFTGVTVPMTDYFLGINDSWFNKFRAIFPMPFYEFFVTTESDGIYGGSGGFDFKLTAFGDSPSAQVSVVARNLPFPQVNTSLFGAASNEWVTFFDVDSSKWEALKQFDLGGLNFMDSTVTFGSQEVATFYIVNPNWMGTLFGQRNDSIQQPISLFGGAIDQAGLARYGYRPRILTTAWFADVGGQAAKEGKIDLKEVMATLLGRLCSYHEPTPLMARGTVKTVLRPDIQPGTRFNYAPFRDGVLWQFYVEGVEHGFAFSGDSYTRLTLSRGLPVEVYGDSNRLGKALIGKLQRVNGEYVAAGDGVVGLQGLSAPEFNEKLITLNKLYITPQGTAVVNE